MAVNNCSKNQKMQLQITWKPTAIIEMGLSEHRLPHSDRPKHHIKFVRNTPIRFLALVPTNCLFKIHWTHHFIH